MTTYVLYLVDMFFINQTIDIPFSTNYTPLLVGLFQMQQMELFKRKQASPSYNYMFRYIDDILSQNNSKIGDDVEGIYRIELELHDTAHTVRFAPHLCLHFDI